MKKYPTIIEREYSVRHISKSKDYNDDHSSFEFQFILIQQCSKFQLKLFDL